MDLFDVVTFKHILKKPYLENIYVYKTSFHSPFHKISQPARRDHLPQAWTAQLLRKQRTCGRKNPDGMSVIHSCHDSGVSPQSSFDRFLLYSHRPLG